MIGGLTSDRALKLVRGMQSLNIVGMDVVEVAPAYDQSGSLRWPRRPRLGDAVPAGGEETRLTPGHASLKSGSHRMGPLFISFLHPRCDFQPVATPLRNSAQK